MTEHPEKIYNVSMGQLIIARYYGGINYNGRAYIYNPEDDTLTREDVLKRRRNDPTPPNL
jgi:hypothetical protein